MLCLWLGLAILIRQCSRVNGQYDYCLRPTGCNQDECCFNIVSKTGPICDKIPGCASSFEQDCCRNARPVYTPYGIMHGYAIMLDGPFGFRTNGRRFLEIWRGIPYALPPTRERGLRFKKPVKLPYSGNKYDATYFRPICAQPVTDRLGPIYTWSHYAHQWYERINIQQTKTVVSEDCLYLNIYTLNDTDSPRGFGSSQTSNGKLPVMVFLDGMDHLIGSGNLYPGHILAQLGIVVVTINYRLGPFGYLSTSNGRRFDKGYEDSDDVVLGNYGLWDQIEALKFVRENIDKFSGDPNRITLIGHGSGAADVALHLLSKHSGRKKPPLFHRAVLMSGSDQMEGGFTRHDGESHVYAEELARKVGCDTSTIRHMIACFRNRPFHELATAAAQTRVHRPDWLTKPWSPTLDGDFIEDYPENLWNSGRFAHIPLIGGMTIDAGSHYAIASLNQLPNSEEQLNFTITLENLLRMWSKTDSLYLSKSLCTQAFNWMAHLDSAIHPSGVAADLTHEYTNWADPTNDYMRWERYRSAFTDRLIGNGLTKTLRLHSTGGQKHKPYQERVNLTQMYLFAYHSEADKWGNLLGVYAGSELPYMFGLPHFYRNNHTTESMNEEWSENLSLLPDPIYNELDRNMSNYMLFLLSNFVKSGNATPNSMRNLTWDTYRPENATYLWLNLTNTPEYKCRNCDFKLEQNYKVYFYAYWDKLYGIQLKWPPRFPIPRLRFEYVMSYHIATMCVTAALIIVFILIMALAIVYHRKRRLFI